MNASRYAVIVLLASLSTMLYAIAFGTQEAWHPALARWSCDPPLPAVPGAWQALSTLSPAFWLLGAWNAIVLFLLASRPFSGWRAAAWLPVIVLHFAVRFMAFADRDEFENVCGVHEGPFLLYLLCEIAAVALVPLYAAALAAIPSALRAIASRREKSN